MGPIDYRSEQSPIFDTQQARCDDPTSQCARKDNAVRQERVAPWFHYDLALARLVRHLDDYRLGLADARLADQSTGCAWAAGTQLVFV